MAASICMMRNLCKLNGTNLVKGATNLRPLNFYATFAVRTAPLLPRPAKFVSPPALILLKHAKQQLQFGRRDITLTASSRKAATADCKPGATHGGGGSNTLLWTIEKILSATLLFSVPAAFMFPSQAMDALMAISLVMHSHWGIEAVLVDYARPNVIGNILPKVAHVLLFLLSITTLGGLFYLIHNDIGIAESIKRLWAVKGTGASSDGEVGGLPPKPPGGSKEGGDAKSNAGAKEGGNGGDKKSGNDSGSSE